MKTLRWQQRFENFEKALILLCEPFEQQGYEQLDDLEKAGIAQRYEFTVELAWKTLKDYMEYQGVVFEKITPKDIVREAHKAKLIFDGENWIKMLVDRNHLSHIYDQALLEDVIIRIRDVYLALLISLKDRLSEDE